MMDVDDYAGGCAIFVIAAVVYFFVWLFGGV